MEDEDLEQWKQHKREIGLRWFMGMILFTMVAFLVVIAYQHW